MESSRLILSRIRAAYLAVALLLVASAALAQSSAAPLPLDPAIRSGKLPNGLTYFIRKNAKPEKRALLRLAVQAGSIDEVAEHFERHGEELTAADRVDVFPGRLRKTGIDEP